MDLSSSHGLERGMDEQHSGGWQESDKINPFKVANPFQMAWGLNRIPQNWSLSKDSVSTL